MIAGLRHMLSGINGYPEMGRVIWAVMCLSFVAFEAAALWLLHQRWEPEAFATGGAMILGAGGVAIAAKDFGVASAKAKHAPTDEQP